MPTLPKEKRDKLIELAIKRIDADGVAFLRKITADHTEEFAEEIDFPEAERIAHIFCEKNKMYTYVKDISRPDYMITKNRSYELEKSVKETNQSVKTTNYWLRVTSISSMIIAAITGIFIALQFFRDGAPTHNR